MRHTTEIENGGRDKDTTITQFEMPHVEQHNTFNQQWLTCHVLSRLNPLHTVCSHVKCRQHELHESGGTAYKESHLAMDVG